MVCYSNPERQKIPSPVYGSSPPRDNKRPRLTPMSASEMNIEIPSFVSVSSKPAMKQPVYWRRLKEPVGGVASVRVCEEYSPVILSKVSNESDEPQRDIITDIFFRTRDGALEKVYKRFDINHAIEGTLYKGETSIGRLITTSPSLTHLLDVGDTIFRGRYHALDIVSVIPVALLHTFPHLDLPTVSRIAAGEDQDIFEEFTQATTWDRVAYHKIVEEVILHGEPLKVPGLIGKVPLLATLQTEVIECGKAFEELYAEAMPVFLKLHQKSTYSHRPFNGVTAMRYLIHDVLGCVMMVGFEFLKERGLLYRDAGKDMDDGRISCVFYRNSIMVPAHDLSTAQLEAVVPELQSFVAEKMAHLRSDGIGMYVRFAARSLGAASDEGVVQNELDTIGDTTKGSKVTFGRGIRKLSATHQELIDEVKRLVGEKQTVERELKRKRATLKKKGGDEDEDTRKAVEDEVADLEQSLVDITARMHEIFSEVFVVIGDTLNKAITNDRGVVVGYNICTINSLDCRSFVKELSEWVADPNTKTYHTSVNVFGGKQLASDVFNQYCGFPIEQRFDITDLNYDVDVIKPAIDHMKMMTGNDEEMYEFMMDHAADIYQNPHERAPRIFVIKGRGGDGKSLAMDLLFGCLLGSDDPEENGGHGGRGLFASFQDSYQVLREKFGDPSFGRKVIVLDDEQANGELVKRRAAVRAWCTLRLRICESKFKGGKFSKEYAVMYILTNEFDVVDTGDPEDNRRFVLVLAQNPRRDDEDYFNNLRALIEDSNFHQNWFKYLLSRDLRHYNRYKAKIPQTSLMIRQYEDNRPAGIAFFYSRFLQHASPQSMFHCMDTTCAGNTGDKNDRRHVDNSGFPCRNKKVPKRFDLSWENSVTVPRSVLQAEYEAWRSQHPKFKPPAQHKSGVKDQYGWDPDARDLLLGMGIIQNKTESGSNITTTVRGTFGVVVRETKKDGDNLTSKDEVQDYKVKGRSDWSVTATAYKIPPLKKVWKTLVEKNWISKGDIMPIEPADNSAIVMDVPCPLQPMDQSEATVPGTEVRESRPVDLVMDPDALRDRLGAVESGMQPIRVKGGRPGSFYLHPLEDILYPSAKAIGCVDIMKQCIDIIKNERRRRAQIAFCDFKS